MDGAWRGGLPSLGARLRRRHDAPCRSFEPDVFLGRDDPGGGRGKPQGGARRRGFLRQKPQWARSVRARFFQREFPCREDEQDKLFGREARRGGARSGLGRGSEFFRRELEKGQSFRKPDARGEMRRRRFFRRPRCGGFVTRKSAQGQVYRRRSCRRHAEPVDGADARRARNPPISPGPISKAPISP